MRKLARGVGLPAMLFSCLAVGLVGTGLLATGILVAAEAVGDPEAEFNRSFSQFKALLLQLRSIQERFQIALPADKPKLEAEFKAAVAAGRQLAPRLQAAAETAYQASPTKNKNVVDFLRHMLADDIKGDNYEEAVRLSKLMLAGGESDAAVYNQAGIAAFCTNDFSTARDYLERAKKAGQLDDTGEKDLERISDYQDFWNHEQKIRADEAKANDLPRVKLSTSEGDVVVELFENEAPIATANFVSLVEKHFYDGLPFHRVIPGFVAQGGDPEGNGKGGPGYTIPCECQQANHRIHFRGTLSMAHAGRDTGGSQFFLTFVPTPHLNGQHTAFGRVIEGMDVLAKLRRIDPERPGGTPDKIVKAVVLRKRNHPYEPIKRPSSK